MQETIQQLEEAKAVLSRGTMSKGKSRALQATEIELQEKWDQAQTLQ
jgi:hypothetical protein